MDIIQSFVNEAFVMIAVELYSLAYYNKRLTALSWLIEIAVRHLLPRDLKKLVLDGTKL